MDTYTIGLDFGTNSVRALVVDTRDGTELGAGVCEYRRGDRGVFTDPSDPNLARQHPADYLEGTCIATEMAIRNAGTRVAAKVVGIGIDTTGSTPIPIDAQGHALALLEPFADNPNAMAWLWKDHTACAEAAEITEAARRHHPEYLAACGGTYSSEWFWAKLLRCARIDPALFDAAASWVELADWMPAVLTGTTLPDRLKRSICAAGHKAMFSPAWRGYPATSFIGSFDGGVLSKVRATLPGQALTIGTPVGGLSSPWVARLGLYPGIPVSVGAFDCHLGAVGSGIRPGTTVKVIGTSTCDLAVLPMDQALPAIPGVCGVVPGSVLPGHYGVEAGQSAVGDIFGWYVHKMQPGCGMSHEELGEAAARLRPGQSGLLALDWHNGNRTVLVDPQLTGMVLGLTLHTTPAEMYRALMEATAFGARMIRDRMVESGIPVDRVIACGGIAVKSPFLMQLYADVLDCPIQVTASEQTCARGSAMAAAVAAGVYPGFDEASVAMAAGIQAEYRPIPGHVAVYGELFELYRRLHDLFGTRGYGENQYDVMKALIALREAQRG